MKAVVSVLGEDQVGIIAKVSALLAQKHPKCQFKLEKK